MRRRKGFTLIEVMIVVAILVLLLIALLMSMRAQRQKAEDARVKSDLDRLKIAFEDYYNDNNCYPPNSWFDTADDCGSELLKPYLGTIPCDPRTEEPYRMEYLDGNQCKGYRLYGTLTQDEDPSAQALCSSSSGSNWGNYGVSSSNTTVTIYCPDNPVASGTPAPSPGPYACDRLGNCEVFGAGNACAVSFSDQTACQAYCSQPDSVKCN